MVIHSTDSNHQHHQRHSWAISLGWHHNRHHPDICHLYPMYLNTSWRVHQHHSNTCQYRYNTCQHRLATCPFWYNTCHFPNFILDRPNRCHCDFLHVFFLVQTENIIRYIPEFYTVPHQTSLLHPNQHCTLARAEILHGKGLVQSACGLWRAWQAPQWQEKNMKRSITNRLKCNHVVRSHCVYPVCCDTSLSWWCSCSFWWCRWMLSLVCMIVYLVACIKIK